MLVLTMCRVCRHTRNQSPVLYAEQLNELVVVVVVPLLNALLSKPLVNIDVFKQCLVGQREGVGR